MSITWEQLRTWNKIKIKKAIREYDNNTWLEGVRSKSTLHLYKEAKLAIGYDECYSNTNASEYLAKARTNSLKLAEWRGRGANNPEAVKCPLCNAPKEDLEHFMIDCQQLEQTRSEGVHESTKQQKHQREDYFHTV